MTLKTALKISIKKWRILQEDPKKWDELGKIMPELHKFPFGCPLCRLFLHGKLFEYKHINKKCPLYEEKAPYNGKLCCKDFHEFVGNMDEMDFDSAKGHAKSILKKLESALEKENKK